MTGALVLRARRNGGEVVDLVGVPIMRETGEITLIRYYAYGSIVAESGLPNIEYDTSVSIVDRSNTWQIVGARVDRQYWHGGMIGDNIYFIKRSDSEAQVGDEIMLATSLGEDTPRYAFSILGNAPIGGIFQDSQFICVYEGEESVALSVINFNRVDVGVTLPLIKAIPINKNGNLYMRLLYPYDTYDIVQAPYLDLQVFGPQGEELSADDGGPYYLTEV